MTRIGVALIVGLGAIAAQAGLPLTDYDTYLAMSILWLNATNGALFIKTRV